MNTPSDSPAPESAAAPPKQARGPRERRGTDRRGKDRRAKRRKATPMRAEMKVLLGLLVVTVLYFAVTKIAEPPPPKDKMVVVEIDDFAYWQCSPEILASHFATQDILKTIKQGKEPTERVRQDMMRIITNNLITRDDTLLRRVREMPWKEFDGRSVFVKNGDEAEPPEGIDHDEAIKKARMRTVERLP